MFNDFLMNKVLIVMVFTYTTILITLGLGTTRTQKFSKLTVYRKDLLITILPLLTLSGLPVLFFFIYKWVVFFNITNYNLMVIFFLNLLTNTVFLFFYLKVMKKQVDVRNRLPFNKTSYRIQICSTLALFTSLVPVFNMEFFLWAQ